MSARAGDERRFGATRAALATLAAATRIPAWALVTPRSPRARRFERRFFGRIVRGAGFEVEVRGRPAPATGTLTVSNHISWADIPILGSLVEGDFVSKDDVAGWPLIGPLARRLGVLFIERRRRGATAGQVSEIAARLGSGGVILFPEGTTGDGIALLPFRTSLFATAASAARVQPVAIAYRAADGGSLDPDRLRDVAWIGEDNLAQSAAKVARRRTRAIVTFLDPIDPAAWPDRKVLAEAARAAIAAVWDASRAAN